MHDPWTQAKTGDCWRDWGYWAEGGKAGKIRTTVIA